MKKSLVNQLRNNLSRWERIKIIDHIVLNWEDEKDESPSAISFYEYWFHCQGKELDKAAYKNFKIRERPSYADFSLGFIKALCKKNKMAFNNTGPFREDDYTNDNGICLFKQNSERTIDDDLSILRYYLSESHYGDELIFNKVEHGYSYKKTIGLSLDNMSREHLKVLKEQTSIVLDKLRQLKITKYDMAPVIKELDSVLGVTPKVKEINKIISYDRDNSIDNTKFFNKLFEFISNKKGCSMTWENNKKEVITDIPIIPLYLKQNNNRWYVLYIRQKHLITIDDFRNLNHFKELCMDYFDMTPLDQIKKIDNLANNLKKPDYLGKVVEDYFKYVFGTLRPRIYNQNPNASREIFPEKVLFRVSRTDTNAAFLRFRLKTKGPRSSELEAKMFPNIELNMEKTNKDFFYYNAEFYVAPDVINKILSYLPLIEIIEGDAVKSAIKTRINNYLGK